MEEVKKMGVRLVISGKVQHVGLQVRIEAAAKNLCLYGYVFNRSDGKVEVEVEGEKTKVQELIERIKKGSYAKVDGVDIFWRLHQDKFTEFVIKISPGI